MKKIKDFKNKYLTQKVRNIISIFIIIAGIIFMVDYCLLSPTVINKYIATNIYKEPANSYFDDENFYNCVIDNYNSENKTSLPYTQSLNDTQLNSIKTLYCASRDISSTKGLEKMTSLTTLYVSSNQLTKLDVSKNTVLTELYVFYNQLTELNVSKNTALTYLDVGRNKLTELDVSKNTALTDLNVWNNQLTKLDVSKNTALTYLNVGHNQLTELDVSNNTALTKLFVDSNKLTKLDVSKNTALTDLRVDSNQLTELDVSNNTALTSLSVGSNQLTELDVSKNTALTYLGVSSNQLTELDVSNNTALTDLRVWENQLTKLDVSNNTALTELHVNSNQLTELVINNTALTDLYAYYNKLTELDVSDNTALTYLSVYGNQLTELDVSNNTALTELWVDSNKLTKLDVSKNTALTKLFVDSNKLTKLDVSKNTALTTLRVESNQLTELDVSKNTALTSLSVDSNQLTKLDVSKNTALTGLYAKYNQLTELDVSKNTALTYLWVYNNQLTELDVSKNTALTWLDVHNNQLTELDVRNTALTTLDVHNNQLTELDVSKNTRLKYLWYEDNLFIKYYTLLDEEFTLDRGIILPTGWTTSLSTKYTNILKIEDNKITPIKTGKGEALQAVYNSEKTLIKQYYSNDTYTGRYFIYVYNITSDTYIIDKDNIYVNFDTDSEKILSNIDFDYGDVDGYTNYIENNKLIIKHNDKVIKEYNLIKLEVTSDNYFVEDNEIKYTTFLNKEFNLDNVNINYGTKEIVDNKLVIKYNDKVIKEYNLVKLEVISSKYNIIDDNILYFNNFYDTNITIDNCNNCSMSIINNKLVVKYKDNVLNSYNLLKINSGYKVVKNTIFTKGDSDEDILAKITSTDVDLSILDKELIVKYNNKIIKKFTLSDVDEGFDISDYKVDDNKYIITGIGLNTKIDSFKSKIDTNVEYEIVDTSGNVMTNEILKTGYKLKLAFSVEPMEYVLSIKGDVLGEGTITKDGGKLIAKHIIDGNAIKGEAYLDAADYNSDGLIKMNDVIRMLKEKN